MKALVAEDDQLNRELLCRMLRRLGWDVDAVPTGAAALDACSATDYDIVLVDYEMPGMDGVETAASLRKLDQVKDTRTCIVIVTGADPAPIERSGLFDGAICKPFVLEELVAGVQSALGTRARPPDRVPPE